MSAHEKKENRRIRTRVIVPLIVVLVLINIIAVVCVGAPFRRPSETAELNRDIEPNKEEILAKTTTVQVGGTYIVPKDGIYKIELHGGKGYQFDNSTQGQKGTKVTGYVKLNSGTSISTGSYQGGAGWNDSEGQRW